jgi:hypothetical protein
LASCDVTKQLARVSIDVWPLPAAEDPKATGDGPFAGSKAGIRISSTRAAQALTSDIYMRSSNNPFLVVSS